jgi:hypothetical protein
MGDFFFSAVEPFDEGARCVGSVAESELSFFPVEDSVSLSSEFGSEVDSAVGSLVVDGGGLVSELSDDLSGLNGLGVELDIGSDESGSVFDFIF